MRKKIVFIFFLIINICTLSASYRINNLDISAELKKDGSMLVKEQVTYSIDEINGVYFDIDVKGSGELEALAVYEDREKNNLEFVKVDSNNYEVSENNGIYRVKLYSRNVRNERHFLFAYILSDAVKVYDDVAQLNRKMVGRNWQQEIENIDLKVIVPVEKNYDNKKIMAFGHGALRGNISKKQNIVKYNLKNYYPGEFLEAHILMEPKIFSKIPKNKIIPKNMKEELLRLERNLSEQANLERDRALEREENLKEIRKYTPVALGGEILIWLSIVFYITFRFKKRNKMKRIYGKYLREIPDEYSPAFAGLIITNFPDKNEILATLMDLIRKKVLKLETIGEKNIITLIGRDIKLYEHEEIILDIYMNDFGDGQTLILEDLKGVDIPLRVAKKFETWKDILYKEMRKKSYGTEGLKWPKKIFFCFIAILFFFGGIIQTGVFQLEIFMLITFLGFFLIIIILGVRRPNLELQKAKSRWGAFKNFLEDYSQLEDAKIGSIHLWEEYFVYAIALGVSEKVVKAYKKALEMGTVKEIGTSMNTNLFAIYGGRRMYSSLMNATNYTYSRSMGNIAHQNRSSSFGRGGGFGGGSSGGGGAGGGGGGF